MTHISASDDIITGISDCARVTFRSTDDGPVIDGRPARQGRYLDEDGLPQQDRRVDAATWNIACDVIGDVVSEQQRRRNASWEFRLHQADDQLPENQQPESDGDTHESVPLRRM